MKAEDILARVRYDLPETGKIVVGLSGGADSVLLTYLLVQKYGAERLLAVHVHHGIRGAEADRDAEFVQDYCKALELHCKVIYKDIPALAAVSGEGVEECARRVRYACFAEEAGENGCIATAHNADDNAETLLLNLTRGMGPHGAGGIPPRRGRIYRPILNISRAEVEHLCKVYRLDYVTDSTNLTVDYTRNKLRHSVLPVLKNVNPQMTQATSRFAESMRLQNEFVFSCANELLCKAKTPYGYDLKALRTAHEAVLRAALELLLSSYGRLSYEHICRAAGCVFMGGSLSLPGDIVLEAKQDTLTVRKNREIKDRNVFSVPLRAGENVLPNGKTLFVEKKIPEKEEINRKVHNLLFQNFSDCDKITNVPRVRTRRAGDVFRPAGRGVTKSVKKILNELRIPAAARDRLLLLEKDGVLPNGKTLFVEKKIPEKEEINRKVHNLLFQNFSDCDKITNVPRVRTRRAGDVFRPAGRGVTKSVKKILNELRIPAAARDRLLLLEKDGEIIWIEAVGAAEGYAAKPNFPALELTVTDTAGITRI